MKNSLKLFVDGEESYVSDGLLIIAKRDKDSGLMNVELFTDGKIRGLEGTVLNRDNSKLNVIIDVIGNKTLENVGCCEDLDCTKSEIFDVIEDTMECAEDILDAFDELNHGDSNIGKNISRPSFYMYDCVDIITNKLNCIKKMLINLALDHKRTLMVNCNMAMMIKQLTEHKFISNPCTRYETFNTVQLSPENEADLLQFCKTPRTRIEIEQYFQFRISKKTIMAKIVRPLVENGKLKLTIPDKPRSKNQRYYS